MDAFTFSLSHLLAFSLTRKERFSNVLEMKMREQNKHNKRMEIEQFD